MTDSVASADSVAGAACVPGAASVAGCSSSCGRCPRSCGGFAPAGVATGAATAAIVRRCFGFIPGEQQPLPPAAAAASGSQRTALRAVACRPSRPPPTSVRFSRFRKLLHAVRASSGTRAHRYSAAHCFNRRRRLHLSVARRARRSAFRSRSKSAGAARNLAQPPGSGFQKRRRIRAHVTEP